MAGPRLYDSFEELEFADREAWRAWLEANHDTSAGVWLIYHKKVSDAPSVTYDEAVEEAICFGWIDSLVNRLDETRFKQVFTPRKPGSTWSRLNKDRVARLEADDRIAPSGREAIDRARRDGSWSLLDDVENLVIPADLAAAFDANPVAASNFAAFPDSAKKPALYWVISAKRSETRARRIAHIVERAARNERPQ